MDIGVRRQNVVTVTASNTLAVTVNGFWIMFIPLYLLSIGMNLTSIGILFGISSLVMAVSQFIGGGLADKYGRKGVMILGRSISCCGIAVILLSVCQDIHSSFGSVVASAGYLILYSGSGLRGPATAMLLMESSEHRTKGRNYMVAERVVPSIPPALTVLLGSFCYERGQFELLVGAGLIGFVIASLILAAGTSETLETSSSSQHRKGLELIRPDAFIGILAVAFILDGISSNGLSWYIPVYLKDLGVVFYGLLVSVSTLVISLFSLLSGYLVDRYGGRTALVPAWLLLSVVVLLFGIAPDELQLLVLYCIWVSLDTVDTSVPPVLISDHYSSSQCATWMGWFSSVKGSVLFLGPILTGCMVMLGASVPFYFKTVANLVASLLILKLPNPSPQMASEV